jgi:hypothetical protein
VLRVARTPHRRIRRVVRRILRAPGVHSANWRLPKIDPALARIFPRNSRDLQIFFINSSQMLGTIYWL